MLLPLLLTHGLLMLLPLVRYDASLQSQVLSFLAPPELAAWSAASVVQHQPTLGRLPFEVLSSPLKLCLAIQKTAGLWCWQRRVTGKSDEAERHPATNFLGRLVAAAAVEELAEEL